MDNVTSHKKELAPEQREELLGALQARFEKKMRRYQGLERANTFSMSWVKTPAAIRKLGGTLFCDRCYDHVFVYHNSAES